MSTRIIERPAHPKTSVVRNAPRTLPASWIAVLLASDVALFVIASALGALLGFHHWNLPVIVDKLLIADAIFVALWVVVFDRLGLYRRTYALSMKDELYYTAAALILGTIPQLILFTIFPLISTSRAVLLYALAFSIVLVGSERAILHHIRGSKRFNRHRRTSIVGTHDRVVRALESLDIADDAETLIVEVDDIDDGTEWFTRSRAWGCDALILTEMVPPHVMAQLLEVAAREHVHVAFAPPRITRYAYDLSFQMDGRQALIVPVRLRACTPRAQLFKRMVDIFGAGLALAIFSPVMILAAIAVYLDSGGPVIYSQERIGAGGKPFQILKFRSMRLDAETEVGAVWASKDDPRKTRIGAFLRRFSIDELPQLLNVLRGDMSLVGPRPERPVFVDLFRTTLERYDERHLIAPGITGWSQVHMKRALEPSAVAEKLEYDLQYLENWSLYLDISVLFQTLCEFLFHRAA